jgi:hypothetical protein
MKSTVFALGVVLAVPSTGYTCRDYDFIDYSEGAQLISQAEKAFQAGDYQEVLDLLDGWTEMADWRHGNRRMELVAISNVRTGRVNAGVMSLRYLLRKKKNDPYLSTRLAEALALTKSGKREAAEILARLERDDLIADAKGFAVLASLLDGRDPAGADAARQRCRAMSKEAGVCSAQT